MTHLLPRELTISNCVLDDPLRQHYRQAFTFVLIFIVLFLFGSRFEPRESNSLLLTVLFRFADVSSFQIRFGFHDPAPLSVDSQSPCHSII